MDLDRAAIGHFQTIVSTVAEPMIGGSIFIAVLLVPVVLALLLRLSSVAAGSAVLTAIAAGALVVPGLYGTPAPLTTWLGLAAWAAALMLVLVVQIRRDVRRREADRLRLEALERDYAALAGWKERRELEAMHHRHIPVPRTEGLGGHPPEGAAPEGQPRVAMSVERPRAKTS